jgi:hypothetical protein
MIKICLLILGLLQTQPTRIPKLVWAGAIIIFLGGISMLIYFLTRLKKGEKEQEEDDWRTSRRSLFVEPDEPAPTEQKVPIEQSLEPDSQSWSDAPTPASVHGLDDLPVNTFIEESDAAAPPDSEPPPTAVREPQIDQLELNRAAQEEERVTQLLGSQPVEPVDEGVVLGDDVWAELDHKEAAAPSEPAHVARVEQRAGRESFEPPAIRPFTSRAPFEAPRIDRIVPRSTTASANESPRDASPLHSEQVHSEPRLPGSHLATPDSSPGPSGLAMPVGARHKPAGSVLGLPVESSRGPLILGESQQRADVGIGALSNYGKETGPEGGRGGMVALVLTILVVGGGTLAYLFLPSVHARVDSVVSSLRGDPPVEPPAPPAARPRAQIVAGVSEAVKNVVKARGAVYNVSTEPLENLSVEVSLERGPDAAPDTRTIPITPNRLEPRQQGRYEFEYDGSKAKGYPAGYRVTRLLSNDEEVKFTVPGQRSQ